MVAEVYASLVDYLDTSGALRVPPFDTSPCEQASLKDISRKRVEWFLDTARRERGFPLKSYTSTQALLIHLNLMHDQKPTNAALLLFGSSPQKFRWTAETKCMHCRGTEYRRPFLSMQVYGGDLFEQANLASDFASGKNSVLSLGTSSDGNAKRVFRKTISKRRLNPHPKDGALIGHPRGVRRCAPS